MIIFFHILFIKFLSSMRQRNHNRLAGPLEMHNIVPNWLLLSQLLRLLQSAAVSDGGNWCNLGGIAGFAIVEQAEHDFCVDHAAHECVQRKAEKRVHVDVDVQGSDLNCKI